jgi:hypothetical protein
MCRAAEDHRENLYIESQSSNAVERGKLDLEL